MMERTRVKVCGITSPGDAVACRELGADCLGVIFAPSPRRVTLDQARRIRRAVPGAKVVGVFAGAGPEEVAADALTVGLDMIQLHGAETNDFLEALKKSISLPVIKALRCGEAAGCGGLPAFGAADFLLFDRDKKDPEEGIKNLWNEAEEAVRKGCRIFLAGGLDPGNVRQAVERVAPYGVDVCSGVEKAPGVKDPEAVERFIAEAIG